MYTINQKFGIGQVIETNENFTTVYFEEIDQEKKLITSLVTLYATIEEAEKALNPEISNEKKEAAYQEMKKEQEAYNQGTAANAFLREYNAEAAKKLKRYI